MMSCSECRANRTFYAWAIFNWVYLKEDLTQSAALPHKSLGTSSDNEQLSIKCKHANVTRQYDGSALQYCDYESQNI